jgi:hypothetical protein
MPPLGDGATAAGTDESAGAGGADATGGGGSPAELGAAGESEQVWWQPQVSTRIRPRVG